MTNRAGQAYALTVLTPIRPGHEQSLRRYLDALPVGADGPLGKIPTTHFGRWVIIPQLVYEGPPQRPDTLRSEYLLFTSSFDGELDPYLEALRTKAGAEVSAIWSHCVAFPGIDDHAAFNRYLRHNQIDSSFFVAAYPHASVDQVRASLALRERLIDFAVRAQEMEPGALQAAFREAFPEEPEVLDLGAP